MRINKRFVTLSRVMAIVLMMLPSLAIPTTPVAAQQAE
jgi:hypothetical protein